MYSWTPTVSNGGGNWSQENDSRVMSPGKGYIIRTPNGHPNNTGYTARFTGIPNNGDILVPISKGTDANILAGLVDDEDDEWNLIGNPYPSGLSIAKFIDLPANANIVDGTVYIWTHNSQPSTAALDPFYGDYVFNYTSEDYATVNKAGATVTMTTAGTGVPRVPTGYIAAGQSFFIKSANGMLNGTTANATFNNAMREAGQNSNFFRSANTTKKESSAESNADLVKDRIWLNLTNNSGAFSQTLVGYFESATQGLDRGFDGESFGGNDVTFYSIIPQAQLAIQGRGLPFDENDQVNLGYNAAIGGDLSIRIDHLEGVFSTQNIFLEDKELEVLHDLKEKPYVFKTQAGDYNDRFALRFTDKTLSVKNPVYEDDIQVDYVRSSSVLNIVNHSADTTINTVTLFSISGKSISKWDVSGKEQGYIKIPVHGIASGVYIVKLSTDKGSFSKKVIVP
ncbi:MAG TPA: T9SS type A sorting domain-containing protein, partial [Flavobacterium sp.]|nr:T9SS type A sorting domain-containing protein [Flavobacterium sp.]